MRNGISLTTIGWYRSSHASAPATYAQCSLLGRLSLPFNNTGRSVSGRRDKMSATFLAMTVSLLLAHICCSYTRFTDTGVPCYLRPSGDRCHYRAKPDSPTCTSADDRRRLAEGARQLNRSIAVLEQKLIRLGVSKC